MTTPTDRVTAIFASADAAQISSTWLAAMTEKSWSTVYAYRVGRRNPPASWLDRAEAIIAAHDGTSRTPAVVS